MTKYAMLITALAAAACSAPIAAADRSDERPLGTIRWSIDDDSDRADGRIQVSFRTGEAGGRSHSNWSNGYDAAELQGLSPAQLVSGNQPVRFVLNREAGRLDCSGTAANRQAIGTCSFAGSGSFADRLAGAGIGRPTERQAYSLTLANVRSDLIDELGRHGYDKPDMDDMVAMGVHGVTANYVREIAAAGYRLGKPNALVKFRIFGIDAGFIRDMAAIGPQFRSLASDDLVQFKIFGVKPELVRAYGQLGYRELSSSDLVTMQIHGVTPAFVTDMAELGYRAIPADKLVAMRIHGITADYVRELKADGVAPPSPDQLVRLRIAGYRPGKR
jgi:hypothetical protein